MCRVESGKGCFTEVWFLFRAQQPDAKLSRTDGSGFNWIGCCSGNGPLISAPPPPLFFTYFYISTVPFLPLPSLPLPHLNGDSSAAAWCHSKLVQCVTPVKKKKKKIERSGDSSLWTGRFTLVSSSHTSTGGPLWSPPAPPFCPLRVKRTHVAN